MPKDKLQKIDLEKLAKEFDLKAGAVKDIKRLSYIDGIGPAQKFFDAARNLKKGQVSKLLNIGEDFFAIRLTEPIKIDEEEYRQKKEEFSSKLIAKKKEKVFSRFLSQLKEKANLQIFINLPG
jgi:hypothetical protein